MSDEKVCPQCGTRYGAESLFCTVEGAALVSTGQKASLIGSVIAERYHIISKLGDGGMGQVYLAEHVRMKRKCAVKVMRPGLVSDPDAISRFNREAENASQVVHQNVAAIFDFGEADDGLIYLAMEYIDGESLARVIERERAIHPVRTAEIIRQAAEALDVAHSLGILHRDLKPENIMLGRSREHLDMVKIVDFGIARAMSSDTQRVTRTGSLVGTPEYMSPEQFAGDVLDARTDLYSLALVAFNMLTGDHAYPSGTSKENLITRLTKPPRRLHDARDLPWPDELQRTFDIALASDPADRFPSVLDFSREMTAAIASMPSSQTGEIYLSALASALASRGTPTPSHPMPAISGSGPVTTITGEGPPAATESAESRVAAAIPKWMSRKVVLAAVPLALAAAAIVILASRDRPVQNDVAGSPIYGPLPDSAQLANDQASQNGSEGATASSAGSPEDAAYAALRSGVLTVQAGDRTGIGFLVDEGGYIVTASSNIPQGARASVFLGDTLRIAAEPVAIDTTSGVAVLRVARGRCSRCAVLPLITPENYSALASGAPVLAIGNTRRARTRLLKGTLGASGASNISASIRLNATENGAPLITANGDVVGLASPGSGGTTSFLPAARIVAAVNAAKGSSANGAPPSDAWLPIRPLDPFPAEPIQAVAANSKLDVRAYRRSEGAFDLLVMTPPILGWREAQAKLADSTFKSGIADGAVNYPFIDPIKHWRNWDTCVRERCAAVVFNVVPDRATFFTYRPLDVVDFRSGDVVSIVLMRDGKVIEPIEEAYFPAVVNTSDYLQRSKPFFRQGVAMYRAREFAPPPAGGMARFELHVVDATRPDRVVRFVLPAETIQAIVNDFAQYGLTK